MSRRPVKVVVAGGGFAGLYAMSYLTRADLPEGSLELTLISDKNYFAFLPLLPEMVGGALGPEVIAFPLRTYASKNDFRFLRARVEKILPDSRKVVTSGPTVPYDFLVVALGARPHYFGNPDLERYAFSLTTIQDAMVLRYHLLRTAEQAAQERNPERREDLLRCVVAGAGPSGVEVASEIQRILQRVLPRDYGLEVPCPVSLIHSGDRILQGWDENLAAEGLQLLKASDIDVRLLSRVEHFIPGEVQIRSEQQDVLNIAAPTLVWTAGTRAATEHLQGTGLEFAGPGLAVEPDLRVRGQDCVFAAGDNVRLEDPRTGQNYPPVAPIGISQGIRVAANIENAVAGRPLEDYQAHHAGRIVSLGGGQALADILGWRARGRSAWFIYRAATLLQLVGTGNKLRAIASLFLNRLLEPPDIFD